MNLCSAELGRVMIRVIEICNRVRLYVQYLKTILPNLSIVFDTSWSLFEGVP